jgi:hypothetical protein
MHAYTQQPEFLASSSSSSLPTDLACRRISFRTRRGFCKLPWRSLSFSSIARSLIPRSIAYSSMSLTCMYHPVREPWRSYEDASTVVGSKETSSIYPTNRKICQEVLCGLSRCSDSVGNVTCDCCSPAVRYRARSRLFCVGHGCATCMRIGSVQCLESPPRNAGSLELGRRSLLTRRSATLEAHTAVLGEPTA